MSSKTIIVIEQARDEHGYQELELRQSDTGLLHLVSRWGWRGGAEGSSVVHLRPEDLFELADKFRDYVDHEAGKGEDPPCEIAQKADSGFDPRDGL